MNQELSTGNSALSSSTGIVSWSEPGAWSAASTGRTTQSLGQLPRDPSVPHPGEEIFPGPEKSSDAKKKSKGFLSKFFDKTRPKKQAGTQQQPKTSVVVQRTNTNSLKSSDDPSKDSNHVLQSFLKQREERERKKQHQTELAKAAESSSTSCSRDSKNRSLLVIPVADKSKDRFLKKTQANSSNFYNRDHKSGDHALFPVPRHTPENDEEVGERDCWSPSSSRADTIHNNNPRTLYLQPSDHYQPPMPPWHQHLYQPPPPLTPHCDLEGRLQLNTPRLSIEATADSQYHEYCNYNPFPQRTQSSTSEPTETSSCFSADYYPHHQQFQRRPRPYEEDLDCGNYHSWAQPTQHEQVPTHISQASSGPARESSSTSPHAYSSTPTMEQKLITQHNIIQVAPGVNLHLRGSQETMQYYFRNQIATTECLICSSVLHCIEDAEYILCPSCQTVGPLFLEDNNTEGDGSARHGVALGFTPEEWRGGRNNISCVENSSSW